MSRHLRTFVSRFWQEDVDARAIRQLQAVGLSASGAREVLSGNSMTHSAERLLVARLLSEQLGSPGRSGAPSPGTATQGSEIAPLDDSLRQEDPITIGDHRPEQLQALGLSAAGARQVLAGQPVTAASDRQQLAAIAKAVLALPR
jgi:hypothetical protein